jgi:hypothetical protein
MSMSHADEPTFAGRLMKADPGDVELRRRYEEAMLALVERRLTPWQRRLGWLSLPLNCGLCAVVGYRVATAVPAEPREWVVLYAVCSLGLLAMGLWTQRVLIRGGLVTCRDDRAMEWIGVLGLGALSFALIGIANSLEDVRVSLGIYGCIAVLLVGGAFSVLIERIRRSRLETRVKLLELELLVAELGRPIALRATEE